MLTKIAKKILFLFVVVSLSSCYSYNPGLISSPKFDNSGEVNIGGSFGNNLGANASYNPIDNLAILAEVSSNGGISGEISGKNSYYFNQNRHKVKKYDYRDLSYGIAVGTYLKYNKTLYQDFYIGYGRGYGSDYANGNVAALHDFSFDLAAFEGGYHNIFIQSSLKFNISSIVDLSLDARLNFLHFESFSYVFDNFDYPFTKRDSLNKSGAIGVIDNFFSDRNHTAGQLGVTVIFKLKNINLFTQFQIGIADGTKSDYFSMRPMSIYSGFSLPLDHFWNTDKE